MEPEKLAFRSGAEYVCMYADREPRLRVCSSLHVRRTRKTKKGLAECNLYNHKMQMNGEDLRLFQVFSSSGYKEFRIASLSLKE